MTNSENTTPSIAHRFLNKVPEITIFFWIVKILCTTVGETAADFINTNLNLGLTGTTVVMGILLSVILFFQFRSKKYVPGIYWLTVVLISVFGTLITDNLTDNFGISLITTTAIFSIALAGVFGAWYLVEKTLSIHSVHTKRREIFYWLTILCTFALGTAAGDLVAEKFQLGYLLSAVLFGLLIVLITVAHKKFKLNAVVSFWIAYILTRPLGASIGDYLSQAHDDGGLGLGTVSTSAIFLIAILGTVLFLTFSKKDASSSKDLV
jgi:uncharacterized membrane-anchored protein